MGIVRPAAFGGAAVLGKRREDLVGERPQPLSLYFVFLHFRAHRDAAEGDLGVCPENTSRPLQRSSMPGGRVCRTLPLGSVTS